MTQAHFTAYLTRYVLGFGASLVLTLLAYLTVTEKWFDSKYATMAILLILAVTQLVVQLVCFLHLSVEGRARNRTFSLIFTIIMMLVIVVGSIWIMNNLDYRMTTSGDAMDEYMKAQNKKGF